MEMMMMMIIIPKYEKFATFSKGPLFFALQPGEETTYTSFSRFIYGPS
jgi:hypothetical protein